MELSPGYLSVLQSGETQTGQAEAREPGGDPDARPVAVGKVSPCAIPAIPLFCAIGNVGGRAWSWCTPRLCEFAGWELVHAASSMVAALLQLLVANVLTNCFVLCNCGATLLQFTGTNAACQLMLVLRPS